MWKRAWWIRNRCPAARRGSGGGAPSASRQSGASQWSAARKRSAAAAQPRASQPGVRKPNGAAWMDPAATRRQPAGGASTRDAAPGLSSAGEAAQVRGELPRAAAPGQPSDAKGGQQRERRAVAQRRAQVEVDLQGRRPLAEGGGDPVQRLVLEDVMDRSQAEDVEPPRPRQAGERVRLRRRSRGGAEGAGRERDRRMASRIEMAGGHGGRVYLAKRRGFG